MVDRINERIMLELKFKLKLEETKLKVLCQFVASSNPDGKTAKKNIGLAKSIVFLEKDEDEEVVDKEVKRKKLKVGGFEEIMSGFGIGGIK